MGPFRFHHCCGLRAVDRAVHFLDLRFRAFCREVVVKMRARKIQQFFDAEQNAYLTACARIRGICVTALVTRLMEVVCRDDMVLSILDDDSERGRRPGEHGFREQPTRKEALGTMDSGASLSSIRALAAE